MNRRIYNLRRRLRRAETRSNQIIREVNEKLGGAPERKIAERRVRRHFQLEASLRDDALYQALIRRGGKDYTFRIGLAYFLREGQLSPRGRRHWESVYLLKKKKKK